METDQLRIQTLQSEDHARWDAFVQQCPDATFFHRAGWQTVIESAFHHQTHFLYAEQQGELLGVLPLAHINSRLFGNALTSLPFCVYGGVASENDKAKQALIEAAQALSRELSVDYLELRNRQPSGLQGWLSKDLHVTFRKPISEDEEANMLAIPRKQRAMIRKGIKAGLVSRLDDDVDGFFNMYAESVRNLGTPVFARHYFQILREVFAHDCDIVTITHQDQAVSSVMNFYFRDEVLPYYGGGTSKARAVAANDFMYWEVMRRASERGCRTFDYGRSKKGTGAYSFKKNWGFEPEPLYYEFDLVNATELPDINPLNPKYRLFINMWKRLPLPVSKLVGPMLSRNLG